MAIYPEFDGNSITRVEPVFRNFMTVKHLSQVYVRRNGARISKIC